MFVGRVLEGTKQIKETTEEGNKVTYVAGNVRFSVEEAFKGIQIPEVTVFVSENGGMCQGDIIALGRAYVVYAPRLDSGVLWIGPCSPTSRIETAQQDLVFLRNLPPQGTGGRLYGQVAVHVDGRVAKTVQGATIVIEDADGQRQMTMTDEEGRYGFSGLTAGKYRINAFLPKGYSLGPFEESREWIVEVRDRACTDCPFRVEFESRIRGRIHDATGRPAPGHLILKPVRLGERSISAWTETGTFEFRSVPTGSYLLCLEFADREQPYYYPGTWSESGAAVIQVGPSENPIRGPFTFPLPSTLRVRTVQGTILYPDGGPVKTTVQLDRIRNGHNQYLPYTGIIRTETDNQGRFVLLGYSDVVYQLLVFDPKGLADPLKHDEFLLERDFTSGILVVPELFREKREAAP